MLDGLAIEAVPHFVPVVELPRWLARVRPHLDRMAARSGGKYLTDDLISILQAGRMQLWLALDGPEIGCVLVTEITIYPRLRSLRLLGIVGHNPRRWRHLLANVEIAAKTHFDCQICEGVGQPKMAALLPGYVATHVVWEKRL